MSNFDVNTSKGALMYTSATNMNGDLLTFTLQAISAATSAESVSAEVQMKDGASDIYSGTGYLSLSIYCASEHVYGEWETTTPAGCESDGVQTKRCTSCPAAMTRPIAATGHQYGAWAVTKEAGCAEDGVETRTCANCGKKETLPATATAAGPLQRSPHAKPKARRPAPAPPAAERRSAPFR